MKQSLRTALLVASALLMLFGALGDALVLVPDLPGDLVEVGVRPTVLGGTVLRLYFGAMAAFGFTVMVSAAAIQAVRGSTPARLPPRPVAMGVLLGAALVVPRVQEAAGVTNTIVSP